MKVFQARKQVIKLPCSLACAWWLYHGYLWSGTFWRGSPHGIFSALVVALYNCECVNSFWNGASMCMMS